MWQYVWGAAPTLPQTKLNLVALQLPRFTWVRHRFGRFLLVLATITTTGLTGSFTVNRKLLITATPGLTGSFTELKRQELHQFTRHRLSSLIHEILNTWVLEVLVNG